MQIRKLALFTGIMIWAIAVGSGFVWLTDYAARPFAPANISPTLPVGIFESTFANSPRLVMFVHPHCPCSRATLGELARMSVHRQFETKIIFFKPKTESQDWVFGDLWEIAHSIPNASVDTEDEIWFEQFGNVTSGQVILYDKTGKGVFSGGITVSRGHEGKSEGRTAIESILAGEEPGTRETQVFSCSITSNSKVF